MVEEEKKDKVGSLGWLTESAILSKRHKAIEGMGPSSFLELKAQVYKTQEEANVEFHRSKKKITPHNVYSQKNSGVKARAHSDILQEYCTKMARLSEQIMKILLMGMGDGFEEKYYESEFSQCRGYLRIINYTPPENVDNEEVEGLGMHTDMSCIAIRLVGFK